MLASRDIRLFGGTPDCCMEVAGMWTEELELLLMSSSCLW